MISERIVDFYTIQIRLFKQKMKRLGFLYAFSNLTLRSMNAGVYFYLALQHNTDYVALELIRRREFNGTDRFRYQIRR